MARQSPQYPQLGLPWHVSRHSIHSLVYHGTSVATVSTARSTMARQSPQYPQLGLPWHVSRHSIHSLVYHGTSVTTVSTARSTMARQSPQYPQLGLPWHVSHRPLPTTAGRQPRNTKRAAEASGTPMACTINQFIHRLGCCATLSWSRGLL